LSAFDVNPLMGVEGGQPACIFSAAAAHIAGYSEGKIAKKGPTPLSQPVCKNSKTRNITEKAVENTILHTQFRSERPCGAQDQATFLFFCH
jgi:hypothetical protein